MKKALVFALCGVALLGAGCAAEPVAPVETAEDGTSVKSDERVEGVWHLALNLPNGWIMTPQYNEDTENAPWNNKVDNQMTDVVVQSTKNAIALTGQSDLPEGEYVTDDYVYIRIFRMAKRSIVPAEATDIGRGFSRLVQGVNATYYMEGEYANYKFVVYYDGLPLSDAENVIVSAKEVTDFTTE